MQSTLVAKQHTTEVFWLEVLLSNALQCKKKMLAARTWMPLQTMMFDVGRCDARRYGLANGYALESVTLIHSQHSSIDKTYFDSERSCFLSFFNRSDLQSVAVSIYNNV